MTTATVTTLEPEQVGGDHTPKAIASPGSPSVAAMDSAGAVDRLPRQADIGSLPPNTRVIVHRPVDVRSASAFVVALLMSIYALHWAQELVIPVLMGMLASYALSPIVNRLVRIGLPRAIAAGLVVFSLTGGMLAIGYALSSQASGLVASLPEAAHKVRDTLHKWAPRPSENKIDQVQKAAAQLEQAAAEESSVSTSAVPGVTKVQVVKPPLDIQDFLFFGTVRAAQFATAVSFVVFITYFLLAAGNLFRRKFTRIAGPTFTRRKITVQALNEISEQIQRYLLMQVLSSAVVGVASGVAFGAIGLENAAAWGAVAGVLNLVPYIGSILICAATAIVALLQFGSMGMVLGVSAISIVLRVVSGYVLTPWLTSRTSRLNALVVFIGVLAWGWLWGVWGLLLGTPILMAVKAICDRVDGLDTIGQLLGRDDRGEP